MVVSQRLKKHASDIVYLQKTKPCIRKHSIKKYTINENVFAKHHKIKEDINNKRFPVRVTHFTDLEIRKLHLSTFSIEPEIDGNVPNGKSFIVDIFFNFTMFFKNFFIYCVFLYT
jgi:hypothetical protein